LFISNNMRRQIFHYDKQCQISFEINRFNFSKLSKAAIYRS
jgi:hypothetical protein